MSASDPQVAGASEDGAASPTSFFKAASEFENAPPSPSNTDLSRGTLDGDLDSGLDYPEGRDLVDREGLLSGTLTLHSRSHATISEGYCFSPKAFFRTLLLFFGPAQMVAFGYVDRMLLFVFLPGIKLFPTILFYCSQPIFLFFLFFG